MAELQPAYLQMKLPRWAVRERARQRRRAPPPKREMIASPAPWLFQDDPRYEESNTVGDWCTMRMALDETSAPPPRLIQGPPVIGAHVNNVDIQMPDGTIRRVKVNWDALTA